LYDNYSNNKGWSNEFSTSQENGNLLPPNLSLLVRGYFENRDLLRTIVSVFLLSPLFKSHPFMFV